MTLVVVVSNIDYDTFAGFAGYCKDKGLSAYSLY